MADEYEIKKRSGETSRTTSVHEARQAVQQGHQVKERYGGSWFDSDP